MNKLFIAHADVAMPDRILNDYTVVVSNGKIEAIVPSDVIVPGDGDTYFDADNHLLCPGFIDLHMHGLRKNSVDMGGAALAEMCAQLPEFGVTGWLPTLCPRPVGEDARYLASLSAVASAAGGLPGAKILGFHIEGPFLTLPGALPPSALGAASVERVRTLIDAGRPFRTIFSVAPDFENIVPLIKVMSENHTPVFMTHTRANVPQTLAAIEAGASHATHFYDVFPISREASSGVREAGIVEAILATPSVSVDFILDGVHVDPIVVKMALQCKGPDRVCLITDAMIGSNGTLGRYVFGGAIVEFREPGSPAYIVEANDNQPVNGLAGSGLSMNRAVRNAVKLADIPLAQALRMVSSNPAKTLGLGDTKGTVAVGYDADLTLLRSDFSVEATWVAGQPVYMREGAI